MTTREAYTSVVVSRTHLAIGLVISLIVGAGSQFAGAIPLWFSLAIVVVIAATALSISTVRLAVGRDRISLGLGPFGPDRRLATIDVADAGAVALSRAQAAGFVGPWNRRTTRLTLTSGPALVLRLADGEIVRVSTPRPDIAVRIIGKGDTHE